MFSFLLQALPKRVPYLMHVLKDFKGNNTRNDLTVRISILMWNYLHQSKVSSTIFNPLSARIFTVFGHSLLGDRVLHKEALVAKLLGTHLSIQVQKKVKFHGEITHH